MKMKVKKMLMKMQYKKIKTKNRKKRKWIEKVMKWVKEEKNMWKNDDNDVFVSTLLQKYVPILLCNSLNILSGNGSIEWWNLLFYKSIY